jgi:ribosomal protein S18 acetylase RimI-like enzyme
MIRTATERDIRPCAAILADNLMWERYERTLADAERFVAREIAMGNHLWVCEEDGEVLGLAGCIERGMMGEFPYVRVLAVAPGHRGRGIGTRLLARLEESMFRETNLLFMMVSDFNADAFRLYSRLGYEPVGVIRDYKKKGINEQLLVKRKPQ